MRDTRVILIHCNEPTVATARAALQAAEGYGDWWDVVEVHGVTPMDAAFNEMLRLADREFHVQVDADMVLKPHAIKFLREAISAKLDVWQYYCPLWDTLFRRPILGVKIYRSEIARRYPYQPIRHCETDQYLRAQQDGFQIAGEAPVQPRDDQVVLGDHTVLDARTAFLACLDRGMRQRWLVRQGRPDWFRWIEPYFQLFPVWWAETRDERYLAGFAGLCAALSAEIPAVWGEKDATAPPEAWALFETRRLAVPADWGIADWLRQEWLHAR